MTKAFIDPGICGLKTELEITSSDGQIVTIKGTSMCENIQDIINELGELDGYEVIFSKFGESEVSKLFTEKAKHSSCPVASGILKGIEVCIGLALPKDAVIKVEK